MKYPRTMHLPFSPTIHSDDKTTEPYVLHKFLKKHNNVLITEKMDGGNTCLHEGKVYARSHATTTDHPSFSWIKQQYAIVQSYIPENLMIFGENVYAQHSIEYKELSSFFYVFDIFDTHKNVFLSYGDIKAVLSTIYLKSSCVVDFKFVPIIQPLNLSDKENPNLELNKLLTYLYSNQSSQRAIEGYVIRSTDELPLDLFEYNRFKWVRPNHVQTDEHWSTNWKPNKLEE